MSFAHIQLRKSIENDIEVSYDVFSPDFNSDNEWAVVAKIVIKKKPFNYEFILCNEWMGSKVIPPHVYDLAPDAMEKIIAEQYSNHGYGAWTGRISSQLRRMRELSLFPDVTP